MLPETPHTSLPPRACALAPLAAQRGHNGRRRHPPSRPAVRPRGHDEAASAWLKQRVATLHPRVHLGRVPCAHAGPGRVGRRASAQRTHRWWWQRRQRGVNQRQQCLQPSGGDARPSGLTLPPSSSRGAPPSPLHQHSELQPRLPTLSAPLSRSASEATGSDGVASAASRAAPRLHETIYLQPYDPCLLPSPQQALRMLATAAPHDSQVPRLAGAAPLAPSRGAPAQHAADAPGEAIGSAEDSVVTRQPAAAV